VTDPYSTPAGVPGQVLTYIRDNGPVLPAGSSVTGRIAGATGCSIERCRQILEQLAAAGHIRIERGGPKRIVRAEATAGTVVVQATEYRVSAAPLDDSDAGRFALTVEWRGEGRWAVMWHGDALTVDGEWEFEPRSSSRDDDYLARCRFDLPTALRLAREAAPKVAVNGRTWPEWQAHWAALDLESGR
jgi:uncharacterized protein YaiE (UPF0345 family)